MRTLIYIMPQDKLEAELDWLRENYIFPAVERSWALEHLDTPHFRIGVIVDPEAELSIKLRIPKSMIYLMKDYSKKKAR